ncbi:hypothetical protein [Candidatus Fukatsuia endosymbiont of Drepanosiphum platanoidis]
MDEFPITDLSHLLPAAQGLARLPAVERIQRIPRRPMDWLPTCA